MTTSAGLRAMHARRRQLLRDLRMQNEFARMGSHESRRLSTEVLELEDDIVALQKIVDRRVEAKCTTT